MFDAPISDGGASAVRGLRSTNPLKKHLAQRTVANLVSTGNVSSLMLHSSPLIAGLDTSHPGFAEVEDFNSARHLSRDQKKFRMLSPEKPGHGTPLPSKFTQPPLLPVTPATADPRTPGPTLGDLKKYQKSLTDDPATPQEGHETFDVDVTATPKPEHESFEDRPTTPGTPGPKYLTPESSPEPPDKGESFREVAGGKLVTFKERGGALVKTDASPPSTPAREGALVRTDPSPPSTPSGARIKKTKIPSSPFQRRIEAAVSGVPSEDTQLTVHETPMTTRLREFREAAMSPTRGFPIAGGKRFDSRTQLRPPSPPGRAEDPPTQGARRSMYEPTESMYVTHKTISPRHISVSAQDYAGGDKPTKHASEFESAADYMRRHAGGDTQKKATSWAESPVHTGDEDPDGGRKSQFGDWAREDAGKGRGGRESERESERAEEDGGRKERRPGRGRGRRGDKYLRAVRELMQQGVPAGAPQVIHTPQPAIIPVIPQVLSGVAAKAAEKSGINIKITTKSQAIINEKKKKGKVTTARKVYSRLRRETIKAIRKGKSQHYKAESAKLKALPGKKRKAARDKLKKKLREREIRLVGQLPGASKMSIKDLDRVSRIARKLRW